MSQEEFGVQSEVIGDLIQEIMDQRERIAQLERELALAKTHNESWSKDYDSLSTKLDRADKLLDAARCDGSAAYRQRINSEITNYFASKAKKEQP